MSYLEDVDKLVQKSKSEPNLLDQILAHAGVRGMRWGVRKKRESSSDSDGGEGSTKRGSKSEDAVSAKNLVRKAKKDSPDSLSNKEMKAAIERMNLEQQYSKLTTPPESAGKKFVKGILKGTATMAATAVINQAVTRQLEGKGLINKPKPQKLTTAYPKITTKNIPKGTPWNP